MKTALIISDTHRNYDLLQHVLDNNILADVIIHLGDNYEDLDSCFYDKKKIEVYRVPGIFHKDYKSGSLPRTLDIEIEGWRFHIAHSSDDLNHSADMLLFGHTHRWECCNSAGGFRFNPGHLKALEDRGQIATYGIIEIHNDHMIGKVIDYQNKVITERNIGRNANIKIKEDYPKRSKNEEK